MTNNELGTLLKELRLKSGYSSQRKLAEASEGVLSNGTISRIENGTQHPRPETLKTLSLLLKNITYEELLKIAGYIEDKIIEDSYPSIELLPTDDEIYFYEERDEAIQLERKKSYEIYIQNLIFNGEYDENQIVPPTTSCFYKGNNLFTTSHDISIKELKGIIVNKFPKYAELKKSLFIYNTDYREILILSNKTGAINVDIELDELLVFTELQKFKDMFSTLKKDPKIELENMYEIWKCFKKIQNNKTSETD